MMIVIIRKKDNSTFRSLKRIKMMSVTKTLDTQNFLMMNNNRPTNINKNKKLILNILRF